MKKKKLLSMLMIFVILSSMIFGSVAFADVTEQESSATEEETTKPAVERGYRQLFIAGDSTVFNWESGKNSFNTGTYNPKAGWSERIEFFVKDPQALRFYINAADDDSVKTYL